MPRGTQKGAAVLSHASTIPKSKCCQQVPSPLCEARSASEPKTKPPDPLPLAAGTATGLEMTAAGTAGRDSPDGGRRMAPPPPPPAARCTGAAQTSVWGEAAPLETFEP